MRTVCEAPGAAQIELFESWLARRVAILPAVKEVRQRGFIVKVEIRMAGALGDAAHQVAIAARRRGVELTVDGNWIVLAPPPSISDSDLRRLVAGLASSIAEVAIGRLPAAA